MKKKSLFTLFFLLCLCITPCNILSKTSLVPIYSLLLRGEVQPNSLVVGAKTTVFDNSISSSGGKITYNPLHVDIKTVEIDLPANSVGEDFNAKLVLNDARFVDMTDVDNSFVFDLLLDETNYNISGEIVFTFSLNDLETIPLFVFSDDQGVFHPMRRKSVDINNNTISFVSNHASKYILIAPKPRQDFNEIKDIPFNPTKDGFAFKNDGTTTNSSGICYGMTSFSQWYHQNAKDSYGGLYSNFLSVITDANGDSVTVQKFMADRAMSALDSQNNFAAIHIDDLSDEDHFHEIGYFLNILKTPVQILLHDNVLGFTSPLGDYYHSVLIYGMTISKFTSVWGTEKTDYIFSTYDPNNPHVSTSIKYSYTDKDFYNYGGYADIQVHGNGSYDPSLLNENFEDILQQGIQLNDSTSSGTVSIPKISNNSIQIDGNNNDWSSIAPLGTSLQENNILYDGDDLKAFSVARDDDYLYFLLELYENANQSFQNGPYPHEGRYQITVDTDSFSVVYWDSSGGWVIAYDTDNTGMKVLPGNSAVSVDGDIIEMKIPLSDFQDTDSISKIEAAFYNCCTDGWTRWDNITIDF